MNAAAWSCLLLPLASAVAITLGGTRISRRTAGTISTATTMGAFVAAVVAFAGLLDRSPEHRESLTTSWTWLSAGQYSFGLTAHGCKRQPLFTRGAFRVRQCWPEGFDRGQRELCPRKPERKRA